MFECIDKNFSKIRKDIKNKNIEEAKVLESKLNSKRDIYNFQISFNFAISKFDKEKDSIPKIIDRCNMGLRESIKKNNNLIVV